MSYTIGDGMVAMALSAGVVGCVHVIHQSRRKRLEIIHQERVLAMDKGIPLPELPMDPGEASGDSDPDKVIPILGAVLFTLSTGTMVVLYLTLASATHGFWVAPLPFAFLGAGLLTVHLLKRDDVL